MIELRNDTSVKYSYDEWMEFLRENDKHRLQIDFSNETNLPADIKALILPSVSAFQIGEHSDGIHLLKAAEGFARKFNEPTYPEVMKLFIREENFHSSYLGEFMRYYELPLRKSNFLDKTFRRLRRRSDIRPEVVTLVTAEIIALSYYSALSDATNSPALKRICAQMLHDELPHVIFQSYTLGHFKQGRCLKLQRRLLMRATTLAVWTAYGKVFRASGWTYSKFKQENLGYLKQSEDIASDIALCFASEIGQQR
ncbi:hypothetical protein QU661_07805 [Mogibacterium neglectum]|uniref:hypothetical protein n=1 Tax=Mogibacterium neglectum TaxID=114528 RepID=UPI00272B25DE|nr:hypothetical protein [Mogibacterium neglectum]WLD76173.1 hypothetical protein QU661_07805 [Mogibacterium neglectum]